MAAPGSHVPFARLTRIAQETGIPEAMGTVRQLVADHKGVVRTAHEVLPVAEEAHDEPTADLLTRRMEVHEKTAWMLRSLLE